MVTMNSMSGLSDAHIILPGARFEDTFTIITSGQAIDAMTASNLAFGRAPAWVVKLMMLRNKIVAIFGLKPAGGKENISDVGVAPFPLISQTPQRVVMGLDDSHLNFRVVVDVKDIGHGQQSISASTLVKTNNWFGAAYLMIVIPFHKMIVPAMLRRVIL
jgi:hypothetical protein